MYVCMDGWMHVVCMYVMACNPQQTLTHRMRLRFIYIIKTTPTFIPNLHYSVPPHPILIQSTPTHMEKQLHYRYFRL